jgi:hypothetical protein
MQHVICQDCDVKDSQSLLDLLFKLSKRRNPFKFLFNRNPLPQFQKICRWTQNQANCKKLETIIIGSDDQFRICFDSKPIGKQGDSFSKIKQNLQKLEKINFEARRCYSCDKKQTCVKCVFPYPLLSGEYCEYRNQFDTKTPSNIVNALNVMKEMIFKPMDFLDY